MINMPPFNVYESAVIAFSGLKGSGKDSCAEAVKVYFEGLHAIEQARSENVRKRVPYVTHVNFADKLRHICVSLFGLTMKEMTDPKLKELKLGRWPHQSPREILQLFATEGCRQYWPDIWIHHWMHTARPSINLHNIVIVTDLRFPNERECLDAFAQTLGVHLMVVNVERPGLNSTDKHASEQMAGKLDHTHTIINDGTLEDLHVKVFDLMAQGTPK